LDCSRGVCRRGPDLCKETTAAQSVDGERLNDRPAAGARPYKKMAGTQAGHFPLAMETVYRLPPVLFAIHAPPGRDRFVVSPPTGTWSLKAFIWRRLNTNATVISR